MHLFAIYPKTNINNRTLGTYMVYYTFKKKDFMFESNLNVNLSDRIIVF